MRLDAERRVQIFYGGSEDGVSRLNGNERKLNLRKCFRKQFKREEMLTNNTELERNDQNECKEIFFSYQRASFFSSVLNGKLKTKHHGI